MYTNLIISRLLPGLQIGGVKMEVRKRNQENVCLECRKGLTDPFAILYFVGVAPQLRYLSLQQLLRGDYPPNALICRKHFEFLPSEAFISGEKSGLVYAISQVDGRFERGVLQLRHIHKPDSMSPEMVKQYFPTAYSILSRQVMILDTEGKPVSQSIEGLVH